MNDDLLTQYNPADVAAARRHLAQKLPAISGILARASAELEGRDQEQPVVLTDFAADWPQDGLGETAPAARRIANFMIVDALQRQGVRVELRKISWADYQRWLDGRADSRALRAAFAAGTDT